MTETVIQLTVHNHPGVMSHVTGLFARRAYNLEGILCGPEPGGNTSHMLLLVQENDRLHLVLRNLEKLHDVQEVTLRPDLDRTLFQPERYQMMRTKAKPRSLENLRETAL